MKKEFNLALYLTLITLICGAILFKMNLATLPLIKEQEKKEQKNALTKVMPKAANFTQQDTNIFKGLNSENNLCGYIFKVSPVGYSGAIDMMVGVSNRKITGIAILRHTETPGLGAKAEESSFQEQFIAKSIENAFQAKKDIKAITGSTITSQAVANGIKEAISMYEQLTFSKEKK